MIFYIPVEIGHPITEARQSLINQLKGMERHFRGRWAEESKPSTIQETELEPSVPQLSSRRVMFKSDKGEISCVLFDKMSFGMPFYELFSYGTLFDDTIRVPSYKEAQQLAKIYLGKE